MILESIVTSLDREGRLNVAPMGPKVEASMRRFVLRPYKTSTTYRNLKETGEGVLHVTDDVLMLARTAIGLEVRPRTRAAEVVNGRILEEACRYYEFRVSRLDDREERVTIEAETVAEGRLRDYFGLNRAKHAVVEGAILATRVDLLPMEEILADFERFGPMVEKTGGASEREAWGLLCGYVQKAARDRGIETDRDL